MCNETKPVNVKIPADLSHTGKAYWKDAKIDACIADIVDALQASGIDMRGCCNDCFKREKSKIKKLVARLRGGSK